MHCQCSTGEKSKKEPSPVCTAYREHVLPAFPECTVKEPWLRKAGSVKLCLQGLRQATGKRHVHNTMACTVWVSAWLINPRHIHQPAEQPLASQPRLQFRGCHPRQRCPAPCAHGEFPTASIISCSCARTYSPAFQGLCHHPRA